MGCKRHIAIILAAAIAMIWVLIGCAGNGDVSSSAGLTAPDSKASMTMIGVAMSGTETEGDDGQCIRDTLQQAGYTVELAYAEGNSQTQAVQLGAILEDGASALIVQAVDGEAAARALSGADVADVTVIAMDTPIDGKNINYYVGCDWQEMGRVQARRVVQRLKLDTRQTPVTAELLTDGSAGGAQALEGAMEMLQPYIDAGLLTIPSGRMTAEDCHAEDTAQAVKVLLSNYYQQQELDALLCLGDGQAAEAVSALKTEYRGGSFPVVTASGWQEDYEELLSSYLLEMTSFNRSEHAREQVLNLLQSVLAGETPESRELTTAPVTLDRDNLSDYLIDGALVFPETDGNAGES